MRIWTRKSALIQPRTSPRKSAGSWPAISRQCTGECAPGCAGTDSSSRQRTATVEPCALSLALVAEKFCQNFLEISSNFSKIFKNFCIQCSIFQHFSKSTLFCKILLKNLKFLQKFGGFLKILQNFAKFAEKCQKFCKFLQIFK